MIDNKTKIIQELKQLYKENKTKIVNRLNEFKENFKRANDENIFYELCFCILSSNVGPKIAEKSLKAISNNLWDGNAEQIVENLRGIHKYPEKGSYLVTTRDYLKDEIDLKLKSKISAFNDKIELRDYFANNKNIKGIGYVQASHFLRNLGIEGYAILDKNIIKTLHELKLIEEPKNPTSRKRYLEIEEKMGELANNLGITLDELDLLLWLRRRGYIPK